MASKRRFSTLSDIHSELTVFQLSRHKYDEPPAARRMSWSTEAGEGHNQGLQQHYMDSHLAQQAPQTKTTENPRKTVINCIIAQTSRRSPNVSQKNDSSTTSKQSFAAAKQKTGLDPLKHVLKMNTSAPCGTVPKSGVTRN